jgi:sugar lactone lactonase YvrE
MERFDSIPTDASTKSRHRTSAPARTGRLLALLLPFGLACGEAPDAEPEAESADPGQATLLDTLLIQEPGLHPEGVEFDAANGRFLVGSVTQGTITEVRDDGTHRPFIEDEELVGSIGIHIDAANGRLLVANSDLGVFQDAAFAGQAKLGIYDLESGARLHMVDLGALLPEVRHFANDMTVGPDGTAYVTDSFAPVIYRVDLDGNATVLVEDERFSADPVGLNGIDYHPDGYLLVAVMGAQAFVRVPLDAPDQLSDVTLSEPVVGDGLVLRPDGTLLVVGSSIADDGSPSPEVMILRSTDGWETAEIAARASTPSQPTTATLRGDAVWAVNPHFSGLGAEEPVQVFEIFRVDFP